MVLLRKDVGIHLVLSYATSSILVYVLFAPPSLLAVSFEMIVILVTFLYYEATAQSSFLSTDEQLNTIHDTQC